MSKNNELVTLTPEKYQEISIQGITTLAQMKKKLIAARRELVAAKETLAELKAQRKEINSQIRAKKLDRRQIRGEVRDLKRYIKLNKKGLNDLNADIEREEEVEINVRDYHFMVKQKRTEQ